MALSFEAELRAFLHQAAEQNPILHALETRQRSWTDLGLQDALELLSGAAAVQTAALIKIAKEIDQLRAAINGG